MSKTIESQETTEKPKPTSYSISACRSLGSRTERVLSLLTEILARGMQYMRALTSVQAKTKGQPQQVIGIQEYRQKHYPEWGCLIGTLS